MVKKEASPLFNSNPVLKRNFLLEVESACNTRNAWKRYRTVARLKRSHVLLTDLSVFALNDYFASVFQKSVSLSLSDYDFSCLPDEPLEVQNFEIDFYLQRLKKRGGGPDGIPFWIFKNNYLFVFCYCMHSQ